MKLGYSKRNRKSKDIDNRRNGDFGPVVVPKSKRNISGIEDKIISLYARGMSTRDIHDQINEIYRIEVSSYKYQ